MKIETALILCGGKGTRLKKRIENTPKILAKIKNKNFIDYQLKWLEKQGIKLVYLLTKYKSKNIEDYILENKNKYKMKIYLIKEDQFLGTGGAVKNAVKVKKLKKELFIVNGDTYFNIKKINNYFTFHKKHKFTISIGCSYKKNNSRYGKIEINNNILKNINISNSAKQGIVFSGLYLINSELIKKYKQNKFQIEDFFQKIKKNVNIGVYVFKSKNFFFDYGTVESYDYINKKGFKKIF